MFDVFRCMGVPVSLRRLVKALYRDLVTAVDFAGETVAELALSSGIKQVCSLSGTLFALAFDPMIRRYLANITLASSKLCAFADDISLAIARLATQVRAILERFDQWALASALHLNPAKCVLIPARGIQEAVSPLAGFPKYSGMHVASHGKYLGIEIGPDAATYQWAEVLAKARARVADVRLQGQSMAVRIDFYNCYITS